MLTSNITLLVDWALLCYSNSVCYPSTDFHKSTTIPFFFWFIQCKWFSTSGWGVADTPRTNFEADSCLRSGFNLFCIHCAVGGGAIINLATVITLDFPIFMLSSILYFYRFVDFINLSWLEQYTTHDLCVKLEPLNTSPIWNHCVQLNSLSQKLQQLSKI